MVQTRLHYAAQALDRAYMDPRISGHRIATMERIAWPKRATVKAE